MSYLDLSELADELEELNELRLKCKDFETEMDEEDQDRLRSLEGLQDSLPYDSLADSAENLGTLIPDSEWVDYCQELAHDLGMIDPNSAISDFIDWDRWADAVRSDYYHVDFDGETYYYRE